MRHIHKRAADPHLIFVLHNAPEHPITTVAARAKSLGCCRKKAVLVGAVGIEPTTSPVSRDALSNFSIIRRCFHDLSWRSRSTASLRVLYCSVWTSRQGPRFFRDFE